MKGKPIVGLLIVRDEREYLRDKHARADRVAPKRVYELVTIIAYLGISD